MAANNFKIEGEKIHSYEDFMDREENGAWSNLLYWPDEFPQALSGAKVFRNKIFSEISFKDTAIQNVRFINCQFRGCLLAGASVIDCEFINCAFERTNTNKLKINGCLFPPDGFENNFDYKVDTNIGVDLYHSLYKNAVDEHQPQHAIESLYRMKAAEMFHLDSQKKRGVITPASYWWRKARFFLYDFVSGYGLRTWKVFRFVGIILFFFAAINYIYKDAIFSDGKVETFIDSLYFTSITITTLGFGDITPVTQVGKILVVAEALSGFIAISLLLAAIASKALRAR